MTEQEARAASYWVLFASSNEFNFEEQLVPNSEGVWKARATDPDVEPGDVVYLFHTEVMSRHKYVEGQGASIYGWGRAVGRPTASVMDRPAATAGAWQPELQVRVRYAARLQPPISPSEFASDKVIGHLSRMSLFTRSMGLTAPQAVKINRLMLTRGVIPPPDPEGIQEAANSHDTPTPERLTLGQVLETYKYSHLNEEIFKRAGDFALERSRRGHAVSTSCLLFAVAEIGKSHEVNSGAAAFFSAWLRERAGGKYEEAFSRFMEEGLRKSSQAEFPDATPSKSNLRLSPRARRCVNRALALAKYTTRGERIYGRHLIGALILEAEDSESGAARRLAEMGLNTQPLRADFFNLINHPSTDEKEIELWRGTLFGGGASQGLGLLKEVQEAEPAPAAKTFLPRIDADDLKGEDRLGIMGEVRAFASIIAARDVKTPLSIGLFGDWGSGKSFFIAKLKEEVARIAGRVRARGAGEETAFLGNVVQIDFNAWHYAEANLWASLVSHVFENLSLSDEHDRRKAEERKRLLLAQLDTTLGARREAESEVAARRREEESARAALERARREQTDAGLSLGRVLGREVWGLVREHVEERPEVKRVLEDASQRLGRAGLPANLGEFRQELAATRAAAGQAHGYLAAVFNDPRRWLKVLLILAATLLVPLAVAYALARWPPGEAWGRVLPSVAPVLTLLGGAAAWLRSRRGEVERALSVLGEASRRLDELYAAARDRHEREVRELRSRLDAKEAEVKAAAGALEEAERGVRETVAALRELEPGAVLEKFVTERAASEDYRKLLGVVALIRRDFKKLSDLLGQQGDAELREAVRQKLLKDREEREEARAGGEAGPRPDDADVERALDEYRIDRIVLYIDDLDRCPPKQVVDVLQAIHLLLAFELFVVVVGVDARWVRHSLHEQFPALLSGEADEGDPHRVKAATPRDYIEKIFQVPFWLRPMGHEGSTDLLLGLIPDAELRPAGADGKEDAAAPRRGEGAAVGASSKAPAGPAVSKSPAAGGPPTPAPPAVGAASVGEAEPDARRGATAVKTFGTADRDGGAFALRPDNLLLEAKERDAMVKLAKVIGRTPRTLKRFVNVYRIIKAGLRGERLEAFMGEGDNGGEFRAVLVLLAVAHGAPDIAPAIFHELKGRCAGVALSGEDDAGFKAFLDDMKKTAPAAPEVWRGVADELGKFAGDSAGDIPLAVLGRWLPVVVRYTFQLGRMSDDFA